MDFTDSGGSLSLHIPLEFASDCKTTKKKFLDFKARIFSVMFAQPIPIVNLTFHSLNGGLLKVTSTVPLKNSVIIRTGSEVFRVSWISFLAIVLKF